MEHNEMNPLKWPDGWIRTRIQDRKPQSAWKKPQRVYYDMLLKELERLGATSALLTTNTDPRDPMSLHACGQACLLRMVSGLIGARK